MVDATCIGPESPNPPRCGLCCASLCQELERVSSGQVFQSQEQKSPGLHTTPHTLLQCRERPPVKGRCRPPHRAAVPVKGPRAERTMTKRRLVFPIAAAASDHSCLYCKDFCKLPQTGSSSQATQPLKHKAPLFQKLVRLQVPSPSWGPGLTRDGTSPATPKTPSRNSPPGPCGAQPGTGPRTSVSKTASIGASSFGSVQQPIVCQGTCWCVTCPALPV